MQKILAVLMILLALVLAIAPVFTDCESQGGMLKTPDGRSISMKCHWAGIAEIAVALPLALAGAYALGGRRKETIRFAATIGAASGIMSILLPTVLIGTCGNETMPCNLAMKPILLAAGILTILASIALFAVARERTSASAGTAE